MSWEQGTRYVQDGKITTTAGVTSGIFGALHLVEQMAGVAEAKRVGGEVAYPEWSLGAPLEIVSQRWTLQDLCSIIALVAPWFRPTIGVGIVDGLGEIAIAAPFEVHANSWMARTIPVAPTATITTRHGLRLVVAPVAPTQRVDRLLIPGPDNPDDVDQALTRWASNHHVIVETPNSENNETKIAFDPMLVDLAAHCDQATAQATAKSMEYPVAHLQLAGPAWPWRPTALLGLIIAASAQVSFLPAIVARKSHQ